MYGVIIAFIIASFSLQARTILIDPGHGGTEYGAVAKVYSNGSKNFYYVYEKQLCLILAKKIKNILRNDFTTYLTRSLDRTVTLQERAVMAEKVKADLFVSIHFNSSNDKRSHGIEIYYLDNHNDAAVKKVEKLENKSLLGEDKIINQILIDLVIQKTVDSSKRLAKSIHTETQKKIIKRYKRKDRGVRAGLFFVLALSKRPGVLIEAGFMSSKEELKKIRSSNYLNDYAQAIADGIKSYF